MLITEKMLEQASIVQEIIVKLNAVLAGKYKTRHGVDALVWMTVGICRQEDVPIETLFEMILERWNVSTKPLENENC